MLRTEAMDTFNRIRRLYPEWEPTDEQIEAWLDHLLPIRKPEEAWEAAKLHHRSARMTSRPIAALFQVALQTLRDRTTPSDSRQVVGNADEGHGGPWFGLYAAFCEAAPPDRPSLLGQCQPVVYPRHKGPQEGGDPSPAQQEAHAVQVAATWQRQVGGKWTARGPMNQANVPIRSQIAATSAEIRGQKLMPPDQAREWLLGWAKRERLPRPDHPVEPGPELKIPF